MEEKDLKGKGKTQKSASAALDIALKRAQADGWEILHAPGHGWVVETFDEIGMHWVASIRVIRRVRG